MLILLFSSFAFISGKEISNFETLRNKLVYAQVGFQFDKHRDDSCDGTEQGSRDGLGPPSSGVRLRPLFRNFPRPTSEFVLEADDRAPSAFNFF